VQVSFNVDLKVNVFEANIRLLGGLLSAHLLASDTGLGLMRRPYKGELLAKATDLGNRLMAAFEASPTGAPCCLPLSMSCFHPQSCHSYMHCKKEGILLVQRLSTSK